MYSVFAGKYLHTELFSKISCEGNLDTWFRDLIFPGSSSSFPDIRGTRCQKHAYCFSCMIEVTKSRQFLCYYFFFLICVEQKIITPLTGCQIPLSIDCSSRSSNSLTDNLWWPYWSVNEVVLWVIFIRTDNLQIDLCFRDELELSLLLLSKQLCSIVSMK